MKKTEKYFAILLTIFQSILFEDFLIQILIVAVLPDSHLLPLVWYNIQLTKKNVIPFYVIPHIKHIYFLVYIITGSVGSG